MQAGKGAKLRIDLGCGKNKVEGCIGVDIHLGNEPDIKADVRRPIRGLEDGCAEYVVCRHVLEHLGLEEWRDVLAEIARLLEPGGRFEIRVPHPACENAMIHGHSFVLTPLYWQHLQEGKVAHLRLPLEIDRIVEIPDPRALEYCKTMGWVFDEHSRFMFNAYFETAIYGHRC